MSKVDAERALRIYRSFVKQTEQVVRYLSIARHYDHATRLEIPKIKHAPTSLTSSLEEYLKDPDFDVNRQQYLAEHQSKKGGKTSNGTPKPIFSKASAAPSSGSSFPEPKPQALQQQSTATAKGPAPDLIDFFSSIEQNQEPMAQNAYQQPSYNNQIPQQQAVFPSQQQQANLFMIQQTGMPVSQTGFPTQSPPGTNPFLHMQQQQPLQQQQTQFQPQQPQQHQPMPQGYQPHQPRFTTGLASIPQSNVPNFQQQPSQQQAFGTGLTDASSSQTTNPFRQSMLASTPTASTMSSLTSASNSPMGSQPAGYNPFGRPVSSHPSQQMGVSSPFGQQGMNTSPFGQFSQQQFSQQQHQQQPYQQQQQPSIMPQPTGTNPFAQQQAPQYPQPQPSMPNPTGTTNPFRQSAFVNQNTGIGWQSTSQGTIGGIPIDQVGTVPIFPRPGMG